jgi:uncharacterized membrane protein YqjE
MLRTSFQQETEREQGRQNWRPESESDDRSDVDFELDTVSASEQNSEPVSDLPYERQANSESSNKSTISPLNAIHVLRSAGGALLAQLGLHGRLAEIEWKEQKLRLLKMTLFALLGFTCLLCVMVFAGVLILAFSWDTEYRILAALLLLAAYCAATGYAWSRFKTLAALSHGAFAATRAELAADIALIKSKL